MKKDSPVRYDYDDDDDNNNNNDDNSCGDDTCTFDDSDGDYDGLVISYEDDDVDC